MVMARIVEVETPKRANSIVGNNLHRYSGYIHARWIKVETVIGKLKIEIMRSDRAKFIIKIVVALRFWKNKRKRK